MFAALVVVAFAAGCGGAGPGGGGPAPSDEAREAALAAIAAYGDSLPATDLDARRTAMLAYLGGRSEFEASGAFGDDAGLVWARFTDGRLLVLGAPRAPAEAPIPLPDSDPVPPSDPYGTQAVGISESPNVRLFDSLGGGFVDTLPTLAAQFARHGYTVPKSGMQKGTIDDWKALGDEALLVFDAHGGMGKDRSNGDVMAIWTDDLMSAAADAREQADLDANRLVYVMAENNGKMETHYGVTAAFLGAYVKFKNRTAVLASACYSGKLSTGFIASNANLYMGWTKRVRDADAGYGNLFMADRTLGRYKLLPVVKNPKLPLTWAKLSLAMQASVNPATMLPYNASTTGAHLVFYGGPGDLVTLPPIIQTGRMNSVTKEILLTGTFGPGPFEVFENPNLDGTGGTKLVVKSATESTLNIQGTQANSTVIVKVGQHQSNVFRLPGGLYVIKGIDAMPFRVRNRMVVKVSGVQVFADPVDRADGNHDSVSFAAMNGDTLTIEVYSSGLYGGLGYTILSTPISGEHTLMAMGGLDLFPNKDTGLVFKRDYPLWNYDPVY